MAVHGQEKVESDLGDHHAGHVGQRPLAHLLLADLLLLHVDLVLAVVHDEEALLAHVPEDLRVLFGQRGRLSQEEVAGVVCLSLLPPNVEFDLARGGLLVHVVLSAVVGDELRVGWLLGANDRVLQVLLSCLLTSKRWSQ